MQFALAEVDYASRSLADGSDFRRVSPKGYVPALSLDDGNCLTEIIAIFDYIDFCAPQASLLGQSGTADRQVAIEWLAFVATEIHKSFSPLFRPGTPPEFLEPGVDHLKRRLSVTENRLAQQTYLSADNPTAADYYLFVVARWMSDVGLCIADWPHISDHSARISARSTVQNAIASENL